MRTRYLIGCLALGACAGASDPPATLDPDRALSAGEGTVLDTTRDAFGRPLANMRADRRDAFFVGNSFFNRTWVAAPTSTESFDGLGPTFNATSCSACHFKDGRGRPPAEGDRMLSMLLRLSVPGADAHGGPAPEPTYGGQLEPNGILSVPGEGTPKVSYVEQPGSYPDGTPYSLRLPTYRIDELHYGPLAASVLISPRVAPMVAGVGLLEAVDDATLLALADPDDRDGDGVRGRVNRVWDEAAGALRIGRFGWKANQPSVAQQNAGAFLGDMGITSPLFPKENCPTSHLECRAAKSGGSPEIVERDLAAVLFYTRVLAVPARRNVDDPQVVAGEQLFSTIGCATCHVAALTTGAAAAEPELQMQKIRPFTDLLLHDLGEGLADGRPDFSAGPRDWRTTPLWGLGMIETVNGHTLLLHDGRARGPEEAVLWHDGEAKGARQRFTELTRDERTKVIAFLRSL